MEALMEQPQLKGSLTVAEVLVRWPQTISVFMHHRMACVGCAIAPFETLAEVANVYDLELYNFLGELEGIIKQPRARS
jgi:hybrid cluster-associated redox disulfide protein